MRIRAPAESTPDLPGPQQLREDRLSAERIALLHVAMFGTDYGARVASFEPSAVQHDPEGSESTTQWW